MASASVWSCPGCGNRYRIKTGRREPKLCPNCRSQTQGNTFVHKSRLPAETFAVDQDWTPRRGPRSPLPVWLWVTLATLTAIPVLAAGFLMHLDKPFTPRDMLYSMICVVVAIAALAFYLLPTIIALFRHHPNSIPLGIINTVFGWTLIGYVGCLAWSLVAIDQR